MNRGASPFHIEPISPAYVRVRTEPYGHREGKIVTTLAAYQYRRGGGLPGFFGRAAIHVGKLDRGLVSQPVTVPPPVSRDSRSTRGAQSSGPRTVRPPIHDAAGSPIAKPLPVTVPPARRCGSAVARSVVSNGGSVFVDAADVQGATQQGGYLSMIRVAESKQARSCKQVCFLRPRSRPCRIFLFRRSTGGADPAHRCRPENGQAAGSFLLAFFHSGAMARRQMRESRRVTTPNGPE